MGNPESIDNAALASMRHAAGRGLRESHLAGADCRFDTVDHGVGGTGTDTSDKPVNEPQNQPGTGAGDQRAGFAPGCGDAGMSLPANERFGL